MNEMTQQANGLPAGWVWTTLGEVADNTRKRVQPQDYPTLRFVGMEHVEAHTMRVLSTVPASEMRSTAEYFEPGDVLYGRLRPYLNKVFCADFTGLCSGEFIAFRKTARVASKYLLYFLNSWEFVSFASHLNEGDRPRVNSDQLAGYPFPLAPLPEQHRIVAEIETQFTRLDAGVAALKRVQATLRRYKAAVLKAACEGRLVPTEAELARVEGRPYEPASALLARILAERRARWQQANPGKRYVEPKGVEAEGLAALPEGWVWATVEQLAAHEPNAITDGPFGSKLKTEHYTPVGPRVIRLQNIGEGEFRDVKAHISEQHFEYLRRHQVFAGDLVIAGLGEILPRACVIPDFVGSAIVKADCIRLKPHDRLADAAYLNVALNSEVVRKIAARIVHGIGRPRMNQQEIRSLPIPLPPLAEQHCIVAEVERRLSVAQEVEATVAASLRRAERLRQSILKRAFEGRLAAQDPNDEPARMLLERLKANR